TQLVENEQHNIVGGEGKSTPKGRLWRCWRLVEVGGGRCNSWQHPRKHDVGLQAFEQLRPHARHAVEPRQVAERTMALTPGDDALRKGGPDAGETCDLRHVGAVEVDALAGQERSREPGGFRAVAESPPGGGVSTDTSRTSPGAAALAGASASRTPAPARARRASSSAARRSSIPNATDR